MHPSAQRVQKALIELGYTGQVIEHEGSTRTAIEAAEVAGCELGQIVKSLVFRLQPVNETVLVLVSGPNRVHEKRLGRLLGGTLERADADYVHQVSGYAIGGVPPVGLKNPLKTYIDEDLLQFPTVWAAAGTSNAVFEVDPRELVRMSSGQLVNVK